MERACRVEVLVLDGETVDESASCGRSLLGFKDFQVFEPGGCKQARPIFFVLRNMVSDRIVESSCASLMRHQHQA